MNFEKYNIYNTEELQNFLKQERELRDNEYYYVLTLKNADNEVLDKKTLTIKEYKENSMKYRAYINQRVRDKEISLKQENLIKEKELFILDFKSKIRDIYFTDVAKELNISKENAIKILECALNRNQLFIMSFSNLNDLSEDFDIWFENFNSVYFDFERDSIDSSRAEKIFDLIANEVEFLRIKL
jgi:hypothetical protein